MVMHTFRCAKCKYEFKELVPSGSGGTPNCVKCNSKTVKVFGFQFSMGEDWPKFNTQLGKTVNSRAEEDREFESIGAVRV